MQAGSPAMSANGEYQTSYDPPKDLQAQAHVKSLDEYKRMYDQSLKDPEVGWG